MRFRVLVVALCVAVSACGRVGFGPLDFADSGRSDAAMEASVADSGADGAHMDASGDALLDAGADSSADAGLDPDLVVWLPLDTAPGAGALDVLGTLSNGRCEAGRCPTVVPGVRGNALSFDGADDYLRFDTSPMLDFGTRAQPFSVAVWYRTRSRGPAQQVVFAQSTAGGDVGFQLSFEDLGTLGTYDVVWKLCAVSCPSEDAAQWPDGVEADSWRFAVGVWTGTESILYVDGVERARTPTAGVKFDGSPFMVGADWETGGSIEDTFDGTIDDLRIYRRVLTIPEQLVLMGSA